MVETPNTHEQGEEKVNKTSSFGPIANLKPHVPQWPTYGPEGVAKPGDPGYKEYQDQHRPLIPSIEQRVDEMNQRNSEFREQQRIANSPENVIARLKQEIADLLAKNETKKAKIEKLDIEHELANADDKEPRRNIQQHININRGKIAKNKLKIKKLEDKIKVIEETGEVPLKKFKHKKSKLVRRLEKQQEFNAQAVQRPDPRYRDGYSLTAKN